MTREEAIKFLKGYLDEEVYTDKCRTAHNMAIKALEQEPCEDAVSRAELKKWLDMNFSFGGVSRKFELFDRLDKELPSVTPIRIETVTDFADRCMECGARYGKALKRTRWVPVSERLPEEEGDYLLWGKVDEDEDEYPFIGSYDSGCEQFGIWQEQFDRTTLGCIGSDFFEYASVIAWMPLPDPYKTKTESENEDA